MDLLSDLRFDSMTFVIIKTVFTKQTQKLFLSENTPYLNIRKYSIFKYKKTVILSALIFSATSLENCSQCFCDVCIRPDYQVLCPTKRTWMCDI